jgi:multisubunit Na+/H+ antiporter MnhB subunit
MQYVLMAHSILRWLIVLAALLALIRLGWGLASKRAYDQTAWRLVNAYSGLMSLQMLLGLIYFLWSGFAGSGFPGYRIGHLVVMLLAVVASHLPKRWKNAPDAVRTRNDLITLVVSLILVALGVMMLPQGWAHSAAFGY